MWRFEVFSKIRKTDGPATLGYLNLNISKGFAYFEHFWRGVYGYFGEGLGEVPLINQNGKDSSKGTRQLIKQLPTIRKKDNLPHPFLCNRYFF